MIWSILNVSKIKWVTNSFGYNNSNTIKIKKGKHETKKNIGTGFIMSTHEQYQDLKTVAAKWILFILMCVSPTMMGSYAAARMLYYKVRFCLLIISNNIWSIQRKHSYMKSSVALERPYRLLQHMWDCIFRHNTRTPAAGWNLTYSQQTLDRVWSQTHQIESNIS